jgi:hypothetical protein
VLPDREQREVDLAGGTFSVLVLEQFRPALLDESHIAVVETGPFIKAESDTSKPQVSVVIVAAMRSSAPTRITAEANASPVSAPGQVEQRLVGQGAPHRPLPTSPRVRRDGLLCDLPDFGVRDVEQLRGPGTDADAFQSSSAPRSVFPRLPVSATRPTISWSVSSYSSHTVSRYRCNAVASAAQRCAMVTLGGCGGISRFHHSQRTGCPGVAPTGSFARVCLALSFSDWWACCVVPAVEYENS